MERVIKVKPKQNFIRTIAEFINSVKEKDIKDIIVIFPNIRPSYYLKKELSKIKSYPTLLPRIYSLDDFITESYLTNTAASIIDLYDAFYIFYKFFKKDIQKIYSKKITSDDIEKITPIIWSEFEELKINKIPPNRLKEYDFILSEVKFLSSKRSSSIDLTRQKIFRYSQLYEKFYNKIIEDKKTTRALMYFDISENIERLNIKKENILIIAGFFSTTKSEKDLFLKIKENFNSYFFFQEHELLDEQIAFLNPPQATYETNFKPNFELKASPSKHAEIFALKKDICSISTIKDEKIVPPSSCAIIMPDPTSLWPIIENILCDVEDYNITLPCSIADTPWLSLFKIISEINLKKDIMSNLYSINDIISLFSHPYIKKPFKNEIIVNKNERFETYTTKDEVKKRFFKDTTSSDEFVYLFIEQFEKVKNLNDFLESIQRIVEYLRNKTEQKDVFIEIGQLIEEEILKIRSKKLKSIVFTDFKTYFSFLNKMLKNITFPFKGEPIKGLQCMGILEARNLNFENVFIIDANEGIIPHEKKDICILSEMVRKELNLPLYKDMFNLYYYHISNIVANSKNSVIYFVENKKMTKSPIIEKMIWEMEKKQNSILDIQTTVYPRFEFSTQKPKEIKKDEKLKNILLSFTYTASAIDTYLECALIFYYKYVVGIKEPQNDQLIQKADVGSLFHRIIEKTLLHYKERSFSQIPDDDFFNRFESSLNETIKEKNLKVNISPQLYFIKKQFLIKSKELLYKMKKDFHSYRIKEVEYTQKSYIYLEPYKINISGRADLIIENEEDTIIIDFKTSPEPQNYLPKFSYFDENKRASNPGSLQMPFYQILFSNLNNPKLAIVSLGSKDISHKFLYKDEQDILKYKSKIEAFIIDTIKEIIEKDSFQPPQKPPCEECIYSDICSIL